MCLQGGVWMDIGFFLGSAKENNDVYIPPAMDGLLNWCTKSRQKVFRENNQRAAGNSSTYVK